MARQDNAQKTDEMSPSLALSQMIDGSCITQAIHVAAKLGVADLLKDGPKSSRELAAAAEVNQDALYRMLRALASAGVFEEVEHDRFTLTPLAALLQTGVPGSLRAAAIMFGDEWQWRPWGELLYSVRTGTSAFEHVFGMRLFEYLAQHPEAGRSAYTVLTELTAVTAKAVANTYDFSAVHTIVDVGSGHGALVAEVLKAHPQLRGILFDLPSVAEGARRMIDAEGLAGRCDFVAGDFFVAVPGGADAYILKWILHDWNDERAVAILKNCRRAMQERGKLLIVESVVPPGNEPSYVKLADLRMMMMAGGRERTDPQYRALFTAAGFTLTKILPTPSPDWWRFSVIEGVCA